VTVRISRTSIPSWSSGCLATPAIASRNARSLAWSSDVFRTTPPVPLIRSSTLSLVTLSVRQKNAMCGRGALQYKLRRMGRHATVSRSST
jgi:hypothetical protein